jgi:hypothetical protein
MSGATDIYGRRVASDAERPPALFLDFRKGPKEQLQQEQGIGEEDAPREIAIDPETASGVPSDLDLSRFASRARLLGPVAPATHWLLDILLIPNKRSAATQDSGEEELLLSAEVTAAAFQLCAGSPPNDSRFPGAFTAYRVIDLAGGEDSDSPDPKTVVTGARVWEVFCELAKTRTYQNPGYNCEDFAKEMLRALVGTELSAERAGEAERVENFEADFM